MPTYNFNQFDATFNAKNDKEAQQVMSAFHQILQKYQGNNEGLLTVAKHITTESKQFKLLKKFALKS
ncbi:hypothetical protein WAF17_10825 [Bernardetia sp. ABR2-2B]|uniref:hypothetical protein n=1 Tax=Bernardetia sp. ABR2-2B TaxID=3127472 RepID=UPI0030D3B57D